MRVSVADRPAPSEWLRLPLPANGCCLFGPVGAVLYRSRASHRNGSCSHLYVPEWIKCSLRTCLQTHKRHTVHDLWASYTCISRFDKIFFHKLHLETLTYDSEATDQQCFYILNLSEFKVLGCCTVFRLWQGEGFSLTTEVENAALPFWEEKGQWDCWTGAGRLQLSGLNDQF